MPRNLQWGPSPIFHSKARPEIASADNTGSLLPAQSHKQENEAPPASARMRQKPSAISKERLRVIASFKVRSHFG